MKKLLKSFGVLLTLCVLCLALFGCGSEGVKYNYKNASVECDDAQMSQGMSSVVTLYDNLYKDSTIEVSDSKVVWTISGQEGTMDCEKDGDKYILGGDFANQMSQAFKQSFGQMEATISVSLYGMDTEEGFKLVVDESVTVMNTTTLIKFNLNFTKA